MVISFLASSNGPLKPTEKISYPDIYIGIPSWLLCIEMAFFAILHIFAFPWRPYSLLHGAAAYTSSDNSLENGAPANLPVASRRYKGFWYAIFDSFNPWDVVKASARGLRWMTVRYRHRHTDSSYEPAASYKLGSSNDAHVGAAGGMAMPSDAGLHHKASITPPATGPYNAMTTEDDRAGLLAQPTRPGQSHSPPPASPFGDGPFGDEFAHGDDGATAGLDLGTAGRVPHNTAYMPSENAWQHDTSYRDTHPTALQPGARNQQWPDTHGRRESMDGTANAKPPPYPTTQGNNNAWI